MSKRVNVIGLGYIGLPTACVLAERGYIVNGVDTNDAVNLSIIDGDPLISEPGLKEVIGYALRNGCLFAQKQLVTADIHFICVPTPFLRGVYPPKPDISHVKSAALAISDVIKDGDLVILESTCPVGTTELVFDLIKNNSRNCENFYLAYCPERVLPGNILNELVNNNRIVGGIERQSTEKVAQFYSTFVNGEINKCDAKTAEICKLVENSFRDTNIAFANELSILCANQDINVDEVIALCNKHPRVDILTPGPGVGGHCIAVDPWFLVDMDPNYSELIRKAREVNLSKTKWVINKIREEFAAGEYEQIICLGVTYKNNSEDVRESASMSVVQNLFQSGLPIKIVEPNIQKIEPFENLSFTDLKNVFNSLIIKLVSHKEFDEKLISLLKNNSNKIISYTN
ncbi:nucleotide sugar dehydrogenase [Planktomarina temperata]|nr:nucleotide sugar dehydrogenase [Planktomarina temperata]